MGNPHELKQLQVRLAKVEAEHEAAREDMRIAQRRQAVAVNLCRELREKIEKHVTGKGVTITEHALLRYFERVLGYDLEVIMTSLVTPEVQGIVDSGLKNGKIPGVGYKLVLKDGVVVTVEV